MNQSDAEALGWKFHKTTVPREAVVEVEVFNAVKQVGETHLDKSFENQDQLLADIEAWEASQPVPVAPVAPEAPAAPLPDALVYPDANAKAAELATQGVDWRDDHAAHVWAGTDQLPSAPSDAEVAAAAPAEPVAGLDPDPALVPAADAAPPAAPADSAAPQPTEGS